MKKTAKQIISRILVVAMVLTLLPTIALAAGTNNPTVDVAVTAAVGAPASGVFTINISNDPTVIGTLDLDDLKSDYPDLALIDVRNTNITDVVDSGSGVTVLLGGSGTFLSGDRQLQPTTPTINHSVPAAGNIDLDALVTDLGINVTDGTVIADLLVAASPVAKVNGTVVAVTPAGTFGEIQHAALAAVPPAANYTLTLEFPFQNSAHIEVVSYALNMLDTTLTMTGGAAGGNMYQGGTYTYTVSKTDEHGVPQALALSDISTLATTVGTTTYMPTLSGNNVIITVVVDASEPAFTGHTITATDAISGKSVSDTFNVLALAPVTSFSISELNPAVGTPVPVADGTAAADDTIFIAGGTSISSINFANLTNFADGTVYLLYDDLMNPISDDYCPVFTLTDNSGLNVQGTMVSVGGNAAVRISAPAHMGGSGTFDLDAPSLGLTITVKYAVQVGTPVAYGLFQIDPAEYPSLNTADIEALVNNTSSVGVTLLDTYTHVGGGWNPSAPIIANVLEGKTTYFALAAQYSANGNDPWFVAPFGSVEWYEGDPHGIGLVPPAFVGGGWTPFASEATVEGQTTYSASNATEGFLVQATLGSGGETVTIANAAQISGGTPNTLYFDVYVTPRSVDHYEFRDATGTNTLTTDSVAIGSGKDYRVYAVYDNGNVEWVDFSDPAFSSLNVTVSDATAFPSVVAGGQIVRASATRNGGTNDTRLGDTATVTVTDGSGKTGSMTLSLGSSLVERFTHYIETPAGIFDYTAPANELKQIYDANSLSVALAGTVEIPRGLSASVWVVPVFSNDQMYNAGVGGTNDWKLYGVNEPICSSGAISTPIFNSTTRAFDLVAGAVAVDVGVSTTIAFNAGSNGVTSVVSNGTAHALAAPTVVNSTQFNMKITEAVLTELDVQVYDGTSNYTSVFYNGTSNKYEITGNVGEKILLRVRATYSDGAALDLMTSNAANTYAGGTFFLPLDTFDTYDPTLGNLTTPTAANFGAGTDAELSVLYGSLMSRNPATYTGHVNSGTPATAGDWIHPHTNGGAVQGALATLSNRIKPHVAAGAPADVEFNFATQNNAVVPGHYSINMLQSGSFTLDFSGQYVNNGYNKEVVVNGIGGQPIEIELTVNAPTVDRVYLVSDDAAFTAQDTTNTPHTNVHVLDTTSMTAPYSFYAYPVILDSSYYTTATYAANGVPTNLTGTGDVGVERGLNYMVATDWNAGAFTFANSSNLIITRDDDQGRVRLKVQLLNPIIASTVPETVDITLTAINQVLTPVHKYHSFGTAWQLPELFGVYTTSSPVVVDINIGMDYNNNVPATSGTGSVELGKSIFYPVNYQLSDHTTRALQNSERPAVGYTGTNVLLVTPAASNPGPCAYSVIGTGDLRFTPTVVGTYTFNLATVNVNGDTLPTISQGIRAVTFTVTAQNMTETVYYGENIAISGLPAGSVTLVEDGTSLLKASELANGRLEMLNNDPDTTVTVKVFNGSGAQIATVTVDLKQATETVSFAPAFLNGSWYTFANNESIAIQWATTYTIPLTTTVTKVVYDNVQSSEWTYTGGAGAEDFLALSGSSVTAFTTSSGIQYAIYQAAHASGATALIMAYLDPAIPLPTYNYVLRDPVTSALITGPVSLAAGQSIDVQVFDVSISSSVNAFLASASPANVVTIVNHGSYATIVGSATGSSTVNFAPLQGGSVSLAVNVTPPALSSFTVSGIVEDAGTGVGIANAAVNIGGVSVTTNASGHFTATGISSGTHVVTATATGYTPLLSGSVTVTGANVTMPAIQLTPVVSTAALTVAPATTSLIVSGNATLTATPTGFGGTVTYTWTSSSASVAVTGTGASVTVTGAAVGTATITCVATDGIDTVTATATVTVATVAVTIAPATRSVTVGSTTNVTATPAGFGGTVSYTWTSSNPVVATVSGTTATPTITGVAVGTATITCVATDGTDTATATATVTVTPAGGGGGSGGTSAPSTNKFTITYNANGGTGSKSVPDLAKDSKHTVLTLSVSGISRTGHEFLGWNTQANGKGTAYVAGAELTVTQNVTLYAQWKEINISLNTVDHFAYMNGNDKGQFMPDANMTRAEVAQMLYNLMVDQSVGSNNSIFSDVYSNAWYSDAVVTLAAKGIIKGYTDGTFRPNDTISRSEFVTMLTRFSTLSTCEMKFSDVPAGHWAYDYIVSASAKGWTNGYTDGTFRPEQNITRSEAARMTNIMLGRSADQDYVDAHGTMNRFNDVVESHWAYYEIMEATVGHDYTKDASGVETWTSVG